jgi:hypothetical protein
MEFVETLAALYQKAGAAHIAVEVVYEQFRGALERRFAVRTGARADPVAAAIVNHLPDEDLAKITTLIRDIEAAVENPALRVAEATRMIGAMHRLSTRLKLKTEGKS